MNLNESIAQDAALPWFRELGYAVGRARHQLPQGCISRETFDHRSHGKEMNLKISSPIRAIRVIRGSTHA